MLSSTLYALKAPCTDDAKPSICFLEPMASGAVSTDLGEISVPAHLSSVSCPAQTLPP